MRLTFEKTAEVHRCHGYVDVAPVRAELGAYDSALASALQIGKELEGNASEDLVFGNGLRVAIEEETPLWVLHVRTEAAAALRKRAFTRWSVGLDCVRTEFLRAMT